MKQGPVILSRYSALNKLLRRQVCTSQDQFGGPHIMHPNGVSHEVVEDDQAGMKSILNWLSFVPKTVDALSACRDESDSVDRAVARRPTPTPYDPCLMLTGASDMPGFFDAGSFKEYLSGWGKSVVVGRGLLGGIPMGAIAVENRLQTTLERPFSPKQDSFFSPTLPTRPLKHSVTLTRKTSL